MSTKLIGLNDRIVTDTGEVVVHYDRLVDLALDGEPFWEYKSITHPEIERYQEKTDQVIETWEDDGEYEGPPEASYEWNLPDEIKTLDLEKLCRSAMRKKKLGQDHEDRLQSELDYIRTHNMEMFFRCILHVIRTFRKKKMIWGIGRGSSCASLVLYLLGVNRVDPVRYDIPMEEFYK